MQTIDDLDVIFWNGPMGVFELAPYAEGTRAVSQALTDSGGYTVIGGGASLEYLQSKALPGLAVLQDHPAARA